MRLSRFVVGLTIINLALLLAILSRSGSAADDSPAVLRAQLIELVDPKGTARAQLKIEPSGEVVFRLRDANGTIRVKIGAGEDGSGLLLIDDATEPGVQMLATREGGSKIRLKSKDGQERVITP